MPLSIAQSICQLQALSKLAHTSMLQPVVDSPAAETLPLPVAEILENTSRSGSASLLIPSETAKRSGGISKQAIRTSLKASTVDAVFATIFGCVTGGVLLSNFLVEIGATSVEIGLLWAIPMVANFLQPVGAYFADKQTSRRHYNLWLFGLSRLLWLFLAVAIAIATCNPSSEKHLLVQATLAVVCGASLLSALACASWLSWMAMLVPDRLRGRYFGLRNSAASLTNLLCVPLMGVAVSAWGGGTLQGYGAILSLGILAGAASLGCQFFKADVNPREAAKATNSGKQAEQEPGNFAAILQDANFLKFLLYIGLWTFAVNIGSPFFNIYLLKDLDLNVSWVTIYNSLTPAANLLMLMVWGKLADRLGNRPILLGVGVLVAVTPLLWLGTGNNPISLWLWLPLLHLLGGGTWAAIDLCNNNIQMDIAPAQKPSGYFAIAAAVAGVAGALGSTAGGFLADFAYLGGLSGLFALSAVLRLLALLPLVFVREARSVSLVQLLRAFIPFKPPGVLVEEPVTVTTCEK